QTSVRLLQPSRQSAVVRASPLASALRRFALSTIEQTRRGDHSMPPRDPWNSIDRTLADFTGAAAWQLPNLPLFRPAPTADGALPNAPLASGAAQAAAPL